MASNQSGESLTVPPVMAAGEACCRCEEEGVCEEGRERRMRGVGIGRRAVGKARRTMPIVSCGGGAGGDGRRVAGRGVFS
jgi:hypothetical protein